MFKKGQVVECVDEADNNYIRRGCQYTVLEDQVGDLIRINSYTYLAEWFIPATKGQKKQEEGTYDLKVSSPHLLNYKRMYHEVMVNGTRVAKVTIKVARQEDQYILLVHEDILRKARVQEGGQAILDLLHYFGITLGRINRTLTIAEWATAYDLVKKLVKLPIKEELKADTVVTVKPLEV